MTTLRLDTYELSRRIVEMLLQNLSPEACTWGENFPEAYAALQAFRTGMIEDVKSTIERGGE